MPNTEHQAQPPVTPHIAYSWEDDVLWVGNRGPVPGGIDLSLRCIVFFDPGCVNANAFTFDEAGKILLPILRGEVTGPVQYEGANENAIITYLPESDTLRIRNGLPERVRKDIFAGCGVFLERDKGLVAAIVLERAAELLIPVLTAEPEGDESG